MGSRPGAGQVTEEWHLRPGSDVQLQQEHQHEGTEFLATPPPKANAIRQGVSNRGRESNEGWMCPSSCKASVAALGMPFLHRTLLQRKVGTKDLGTLAQKAPCGQLSRSLPNRRNPGTETHPAKPAGTPKERGTPKYGAPNPPQNKTQEFSGRNLRPSALSSKSGAR